MMIDADTGCCGANFGPPRFSTLTVFRVSVPFVGIYAALRPLLALLRVLAPATRTKLQAVHHLFDEHRQRILEARIMPKARCSVSGRLFAVSPALSGAVFKSFNLVVFAAVWAGLFLAVASACALVL
jgi:hypothetical protein